MTNTKNDTVSTMFPAIDDMIEGGFWRGRLTIIQPDIGRALNEGVPYLINKMMMRRTDGGVITHLVNPTPKEILQAVELAPDLVIVDGWKLDWKKCGVFCPILGKLLARKRKVALVAFAWVDPAEDPPLPDLPSSLRFFAYVKFRLNVGPEGKGYEIRCIKNSVCPKQGHSAIV